MIRVYRRYFLSCLRKGWRLLGKLGVVFPALFCPPADQDGDEGRDKNDDDEETDDKNDGNEGEESLLAFETPQGNEKGNLRHQSVEETNE